MTDQDFYRLTLRQFLLLDKRHKEALVHREMCHAFTSAAIYNVHRGKGSKAIASSEFMPNWSGGSSPSAELPQTPAQERMWSGFSARAANLAAQMKARKGPLYDEICLGKKPRGTGIQERKGEIGRSQGRCASPSGA